MELFGKPMIVILCGFCWVQYAASVYVTDVLINQAFILILYIQISKKQHQIVTSMKQSGKSIQSRALNRILGNIDNLDVQPYGVFVEEEQKKLNAHWSVFW